MINKRKVEQVEAVAIPNQEALRYTLAQATKASFWTRDIADVRRDYAEESVRDCGSPELVQAVDEICEDTFKGRLYCGTNASDDVLVWIHGGAWIVGSPNLDDPLTRALANLASCSVLSVDYKLAPESHFPIALEECWAAVEWASNKFDHVAVGGDSAGGNLSAVVALRARDRGVQLAHQLLVYPMLDYRVDSAPYLEYRDRYQTFAGIPGFGANSQEGIRRVWAGYIEDPDQFDSAEVSPLRAENFADLAPALIITAEHDILRDEAEEFARRLEAASVPVEVLTFGGQVHGFYRLLGVMSDARDAVVQSAHALRRAFDR